VQPVPRLVTAGDGRLGLSPRPLAPEAGSRVIEDAWLPALRRAMPRSSARAARPRASAPAGFPVLMKTGTAALYRQGYHVNYIGIAPAGDLRIAFCLRLTHQPSSSAVNRSARAATARLLAGLAGQQAGAAPTRVAVTDEAAP